MASSGGPLEGPRITHAHTVGPDWRSPAVLEGVPQKPGVLARAVTFSGALRGRPPTADMVLQQPLLRPIRTGRASEDAASSSSNNRGGAAEGAAQLGGVRSPAKRTSLSRQEGSPMEAEECRICKEGRENGERMIRPCLCGGSMARVHLRCLQQWLERRRATDVTASDSSTSFCCEVCKAPYRLHVRERLNLTLDALCSCASLGFYAEFVTIAVTLAAMIALFCLFAYSQDQSGVGGVAFYISLGMGLTVLALGVFTLAKVSQRWRKANMIPVLIPFSSPTSPRSPIHNV